MATADCPGLFIVVVLTQINSTLCFILAASLTFEISGAINLLT